MNSYRKYGIALLAGALLFTGFSSNALALGTAACTAVSNTATLSYAVGGVNQTNITSAAATFNVAAKVDLTVANVNSPVTASGANQVLTFSITNNGNDTQSYKLRLYADAADQFDMNNVRVYSDTDSNYGNGGTTLIANPAATDGTLLANATADVAANGVIYVHVVSDVPAGRSSGDIARYSLKAVTYQAGGVKETSDTDEDPTVQTACGTAVVEADGQAAGGVGGVTDNANDGDHYATGNYVVSAAALSVTKNYTILWDPYNGNTNPAAIPGAYVRYTITVTNGAGAATATLSQITDALAGSLGIDPDLFTGADLTPSDGPYASGSAGNGFQVTHTAAGRSTATPRYFTTTASADGVDFAAGTITANFNLVLPDETPGTTYTAGELRANESVVLTFNAIIQ